jgi:hypothetical protein
MGDTATLAAVVTAVATVVYTTGTFLLWFATKRSIDLLDRQSRLQVAAAKGGSYLAIIGEHRELHALLMTSGLLSSLYGHDNMADEASLRNDILATMLINHAFAIFIHLDAELIDEQHREGFIRDAKELLTIPAVRKRWTQVAAMYPPKFQRFMRAGPLTI